MINFQFSLFPCICIISFYDHLLQDCNIIRANLVFRVVSSIWYEVVCFTIQVYFACPLLQARFSCIGSLLYVAFVRVGEAHGVLILKSWPSPCFHCIVVEQMSSSFLLRRSLFIRFISFLLRVSDLVYFSPCSMCFSYSFLP